MRARKSHRPRWPPSPPRSADNCSACFANPSAALRRGCALLPHHFEQVACLIRQPPIARNDGDAAGKSVERAAAAHDEGITNAGLGLIASRLALTALPPNTGDFTNTAYCMPGTATSMPNKGLPATTRGLSTPGCDLPMILKSFGSLSGTEARSGGGDRGRLGRQAPVAQGALRSRVNDFAGLGFAFRRGHDQVCAAALTSICRAAAPTRRSGSQFRGVARLPPANCVP